MQMVLLALSSALAGPNPASVDALCVSHFSSTASDVQVAFEWDTTCAGCRPDASDLRVETIDGDPLPFWVADDP